MYRYWTRFLCTLYRSNNAFWLFEFWIFNVKNDYWTLFLYYCFIMIGLKQSNKINFFESVKIESLKWHAIKASILMDRNICILVMRLNCVYFIYRLRTICSWMFVYNFWMHVHTLQLVWNKFFFEYESKLVLKYKRWRSIYTELLWKQ